MNNNTTKSVKENNNTLEYVAGKEYFQYLKDMQNENPFEASDYSASFMTV